MISNNYFYLFVITHSKSVQDRLVSDVLGVFTSFGSSNIILALPSDTIETIIPADDPAVKSSSRTQYRTPEKIKILQLLNFKLKVAIEKRYTSLSSQL